MRLRTLTAPILGNSLFVASGVAIALGQEEPVDFASDVQPILQRHCLKCHGPEKPKGGFRLDNRQSALQGGVEGVAIIPGNSSDSPLIHLIEDGDMPPKGDPLTSGEITILSKWIDEGAAWGSPAIPPRAAPDSRAPTRTDPAIEPDRPAVMPDAPSPDRDSAEEEEAPDSSSLVDAGQQEVDFARNIHPLLQNRCLKCHGPEKPKGRFRLDNRQSALEGGERGISIIPGNSADSPLVHFVAHMVEDMEMPPIGNGERLTDEEVAMLRAWIDQGAQWGEIRDRTRFAVSIAPMGQWLTVDGNEQKFREQTWMHEGWSGGIERFTMESWLDRDTKFTADGRAVYGPEDYKFKFDLDRQGWGFLRGGFEHFRRYYNNYGGYYDPFKAAAEPDPALMVDPFLPIDPVDPAVEEMMLPDPSATYQLDRELHLDHGRVWGEVGFDRPDWPAITLGYEYRFRDGEKSTLHWGPSTLDGETRSIYPAFKQIDEHIHSFRADIEHEIAGFILENNFLAEYLELETRRFEASPLNFDAVPTTFTAITEVYDSFQLANTFSLQKEIKKWLMLTGGYYYSYMDADAAFRQSSFNGLGEPAFDQQWFARPIVLDWDNHIFNVSSRIGPWKGLTLSAGVQSSWESQDAIGTSTLFFGIPDPTVEIDPFFTSTVGSSKQSVTTTEHATLRYDRIPRTVLFAEAELEQESTDYFEEDPGELQNFLRDSELRSEEEDYRVGLTLSPWSRVSLTSHYRNRRKEIRYDHLRDQTSFTDFDGAAVVLPTLGYPGFISGRDLDTHEVKSRLNLRPARWLRTQLSYRLQTTDYETVTDSNIEEIPEEEQGPDFDPILFALPTDTIGGRVLAGEYNSHIYSMNLVVTPWQRLSLNGSFSFHDTHTRTADNGDPTVEDFDGDIYSVMVGGTLMLDKKTDISAYYTYSRGDFRQDGFMRPASPAPDAVAGPGDVLLEGVQPGDAGEESTVTGLPLGIEYDQHTLQAGISRQLGKNVRADLQYRYFYHREPTNGGLNDFDAHGVYLNFTVNWR